MSYNTAHDLNTPESGESVSVVLRIRPLNLL